MNRDSIPPIPGAVRIHHDGPRGRAQYPAGAMFLGLLVAAAGVAIFFYAGTQGETSARMGRMASMLFIGPGALLAWQGVRGWLQRRRYAAARPGDRILVDHPWDMRGDDGGLARRATNALAANLVLVGFLAPLHYLFLSEAKSGGLGTMVIPIIVFGLFDLIVAITLGYALYLCLRWLKFRGTGVRFHAFPYVPGMPVQLTFNGGWRLANRQGLGAVLHCIREYYGQRGSGKQRTTSFVAESLFHTKATFSTDPAGRGLVRLELPANAPSTCLSGTPPIYYEIEIEAAMPGVDYHGQFLVPVYRA